MNHTDDTTPEKARRSADLVWEILTHPEFTKVLRSIVLTVIVEQEAQKEMGIVRSFMSACEARLVTIFMGEDDTVRITNKPAFGADLRAVYVVYREPINAHLTKLRDMQVRLKREHPAPNGKPAQPPRSKT